jgi:hypothetical protein
MSQDPDGYVEQHKADEYTRIDNILHEQNKILRSILMSEGVAQVAETDTFIPAPYEQAAIPPNQSGGYGLPAGKTTFNFQTGSIRHSEIGTIQENLRDFEDMSKSVVGSDIQELRSLYITTDQSTELEVGDGRTGTFEISPAQYFPLQSQGFKKFSITSEYPFVLKGVASTRAKAFQTDSVQNHTSRQGELSEGVYNDWADVSVYPYQLIETLAELDSENPTDYGVVPIDGQAHNRHSFQIRNDGPNDIDARIMVADTGKFDWYDIGSISTAILPGDHTVFDNQERHSFFKVQVRNTTDDEQIKVFTQMTGGS